VVRQLQRRTLKLVLMLLATGWLTPIQADPSVRWDLGFPEPPRKRQAMRYCPACGTEMIPSETWPRLCSSCGVQHFRNPVPVSVVLLPVDGGVLAVRRAIPPAQGQLALPGGFVNWGESWQEAGAREVREETGLELDPEELTLLGASSVSEGVLLLFSVARPRTLQEAVWKADPAEVSEIVILREPCPLAFPTHSEQLARFFARSHTP
jgi:ADP-ribose pyrophosphatase YjhB (NUDIX family)